MRIIFYVIAGLGLWTLLFGGQAFHWLSHINPRRRRQFFVCMGTTGLGFLLQSVGLSQNSVLLRDWGSGLTLIGSLATIIWATAYYIFERK